MAKTRKNSRPQRPSAVTRMLRSLRERPALAGVDGDLLAAIVDEGRDPVLSIDAVDRIRFANRAAGLLFGETATRPGGDVRSLVGTDRASLKDGIASFPLESTHEGDGWARRRDQALVPIELRITPRPGSEDERLVFARDVSQARAWMRRIEYQATHDLLTNLPNRARIAALTARAIEDSEPTGRPVGFLVLDLARFREINDSLGYGWGDAVLRHVARRVELVIGARGTVGRLGPDQFGVLLPNAGGEAVARYATAIASELERPVEVDQVRIQVIAVMGFATCPQHATTADELMQFAETARIKAKEQGTWCLEYEPSGRRNGLRSLTLIADLQQALQAPMAGGLSLVYQPQVDASGTCFGVESLVRWQHPSLGAISPVEFIDLAENSGMIRELTRWCLAASVEQLKRWNECGIDLSMSINLSGRVVPDRELLPFVQEVLRSSSIPPSRLKFEVTETVLLEDPQAAFAVLTVLESFGTKVSIDDFGTGYSSLGYLAELPAQELKIDRTFVAVMEHDEKKYSIIEAIVGLGHHLGLKVIAEGVETERQWTLLRRMGVDGYQGYLFAAPLRDDEVLRWLAEEPWRAEQSGSEATVTASTLVSDVPAPLRR